MLNRVVLIFMFLSAVMAECGTYIHNCMNYDTHWGKYIAIAKTDLKGFVKSIDLKEYRYNGSGCTGSTFLVITSTYTTAVKKGEKDTYSAMYAMTLNDITLHTENVTGFKENGFVSVPTMGDSEISLSKVDLTCKGQPHLTLEKESIGKTTSSNLVFSGIVFRGIPKSPYSRTGDDGCFNTSALIGWIIGVSIVLLFLVIAIFIILVQLKRSHRTNSLYASYAGTGNSKQLQSSL